MLVLQTGIIVFTVILQVFLFKTSPVLEQQQHTGRSGMPKYTYSFGSWGLIYYKAQRKSYNFSTKNFSVFCCKVVKHFSS